MSEDEESERLEATRGEKILASAMVIFLLIGGVQILNELAGVPDRPQPDAYYAKYDVYTLETEERSIAAELNRVGAALDDANEEFLRAKENYLFKREEYRVLLEEGTEDELKEREYEAARASYEDSQQNLDVAQAVYDEIKGRLDQKSGEVSRARYLASEEYGRAYQTYRLKVLAAQLAFVLPLLAVAIALFLKAKRARSEYTIHANAFMAFASMLVIYMIIEKVWMVVHIIGISIIGAVACAIALAYLKKQLYSFERISRSRLKANKCPWCGFPIRFDMRFCQNCGKKLADKCPKCGEMRPILAGFCPNCGNNK